MALQFDDDSIRVISFAADYLTITTKPYEPSKLRILNCEKTRKTKRLRPRGKNTPGKAPRFLNGQDTAGRTRFQRRSPPPGRTMGLCGKIVEAFGFELVRVTGSHHILEHVEIPELINLQNTQGKAKPYQVKQVLKLIEEYNLVLGGYE